MERHVEYARETLKNINFELPVVEAISQMNEFMDGSGYPEKLHGDEIDVYKRQSQSRRRASSGRKRDSSSFTAAWSVSGESSLASWLLRASMSIQMCPSKMIRLRHAAARTAGGVGVSGRCPDARCV